MPNPTFRITTLGCRVNHAETRELESILLRLGLDPAVRDSPADLEVVHTCSVTNAAAAKSRHAVRRASIVRGEEAPKVVVTGCYAGTNPDEAADLVGDRNSVLSHSDFHPTPGHPSFGASSHGVSSHGTGPETLADRFSMRILSWLEERGTAVAAIDPLSPVRSRTTTSSRGVLALPVIDPEPGAGRHVRAEIRIQDGCDAHCTFCIIPTTRPVLRSKRVADAVREASRLVDLGHREIVLSGVFIGAYGHETALRRKQSKPGAQPLADLIDAVAQIPGLARLRISSMEPGDVTEPLLDAMIEHEDVVVPHLHLPLQSGSETILRRMNRQYGIDDYLGMIDQVNEALTRDGLPPAITTDVICGFPGETDADFEATVSVAERVGFLHMHVFPYSARDGTAAARWHDKAVAPAVKKARVRRLIDLEEKPADGLSIRYRRRLEGRRVRVLVEQQDKAGVWTGRCDHYALIHLEGEQTRGDLVQARITDVDATRTTAKPVGWTHPLTVLAVKQDRAGC